MLSFPPPSPLRGRYAPSPTGRIHVGNARTALVAWLSVRSRGGAFVWRLEDLDGPRVVPGLAEAAQEDLAWLGLDWDEGPDPAGAGQAVGGPHAPYRQSERGALYESALASLLEAGRLFPCRRSRKDLQALASAPHGHDGRPPYPARLRPKKLEADWFERLGAQPRPDAAIRFRVDGRPTAFDDRVQGLVEERVEETVGDFVLKRRDGLYAYQLAVVVDDLLMGIGEVVRGADLLASTARQIQLIEAFGATPPAYAHLPLVVNAAGEKLSKRDAGLDLRTLRDAGVGPDQLAGYLGHSLGLLPEPARCAAADLVARFQWSQIPKAPWRLPDDLAERLRRL